MPRQMKPFQLFEPSTSNLVMGFEFNKPETAPVPKETGSSVPSVQEPLPIVEPTPTPPIPSSETKTEEVPKVSSSVLDALFSSNAESTETTTASPTESGEARTSTTVSDEVPPSEPSQPLTSSLESKPTLPTKPTPPTKPTASTAKK